jgi:hypothetical protein
MHYLQFSNWDGNIACLRGNVDDWSSTNDAYILSEIIKTHLLIILDLPAVKKDTIFVAATTILGTFYCVTEDIVKTLNQNLNNGQFVKEIWTVSIMDWPYHEIWVLSHKMQSILGTFDSWNQSKH